MGKKALICTNATIPLPGQPVTGAGLRAWSLGEGLRHHGFDVEYAMPKASLDGVENVPEPLRARAFAEGALGEVVAAANPALVVVAQWPLLAQLPSPEVPVVLDCYAPLLLRTTFSRAATPEEGPAQKVAAFQKADALIIAGERQRTYVQAWQLQAGINPSEQPLLLVPPALSPDLPEPAEAGETSLRIVYGGPLWPWLDAQAGLGKAAEVLRGRGTLDVCAREPGALDKAVAQWPEAAKTERLRTRLSTREQVNWHGLLPHEAWGELCHGASLAFDLHLDNAERAIAYSMRTAEYLWHGVPVIHSRFSPLAATIHQYHAGWIGDPANADGLRTVLARILDDPESLANAAQNARSLAASHFTWDRAVEPLAAYAAQPKQRAKRITITATAKEVEALRGALAAAESALKEMEAQHAEEVRRLREQAEEETHKRQEAMDQFQAQLTGLIRPKAAETAVVETPAAHPADAPMPQEPTASDATQELLGELTAEIRELRQQQASWETERAELEAHRDSLQQQANEAVLEYDEALGQWQRDQTALETERDELRAQLEAAISAEDVGKLKEQIQERDTALAAIDQRAEDDELRVAELEQVANETVADLRAAKAEVEALKAAQSDRDMEIATLQAAHAADAETRRALEGTRDELAQLRQELARSLRERDAERETSEELRGALDELRDSDAKTEALAADLAATKSGLEEEISRLSDELNQAADAHTSLTKALEEIETELTRVREESTQARRAKEAAEARAATFERDMAQAGHEIERRTLGEHDWPERQEVMQAKLDRLTRELAEAQSARRALQVELESQRAEQQLQTARGAPADEAARREWAEERAALTRALEHARTELAEAVSAHQRDRSAWRETKQALADRLKQLIVESAGSQQPGGQ